MFIRVLVLQLQGQWLAQGLEYDLSAQGQSDKQAVDSFIRLLRARLRRDLALGRVPLADLQEAPERFQELWAELDKTDGDLHTSSVVGDEIPPAYVIRQIARNTFGFDLNH